MKYFSFLWSVSEFIRKRKLTERHFPYLSEVGDTPSVNIHAVDKVTVQRYMYLLVMNGNIDA